MLTPTFQEALKMLPREQWPEIAVEKINGPILMFSGSDNQVCPH